MKLLKKENFKIYLLYILFVFGGIWNALNMFQNTMQVLTSLMLITVSLLLLHNVLKSLHSSSKSRFLLWCFLVLLFSWSVECLGVYTHFPFGKYHYGQILKPKIFQIPLVIGFSWLTICLSSLVITLKIINHYQIKKPYHNYIIPVLTASLMLIFDIVMENAAPKLEYWTWTKNNIPLQNYLSWFILGFLFSYLWLRLNIYIKNLPGFGIHVYLSQFIYFMIFIFKK